MGRKKRIALSILGIVGIVVITAGVTYAFFNYAKEGTTENSVTTGTITFLYTEVDQVGAGISIEDALPTTDAVGKVLTGEGNVFNFKVTGNTKGKASIFYEVTARKKNTSTLDESAVRVYLTEIDGTEKEILLDNYSDLAQTTKIGSDVAIEKTIYTGKIYADTLNYEKNFRLRMWLDNEVDFSSGEYNGKTFTLTVNVYSNAKVVTDSEVAEESRAEITNITAGEIELVRVENEAYQYETALPEGTTSTVIEVETESPNATVDIEKVSSLENINNTKTYSVKRLAVTKVLDLDSGDNFFKVTVTSENGKVDKQYGIRITVGRLLKDLILSSNTLVTSSPTLNTTSDAVNQNGLYVSTDTNSGKPTYYFRGNVTNNYVSFAGFTWRIVRINEDGTIRMIMSNGINNNTQYSFSNNGKEEYYSNSDAKNTLDSWYQSNLASYDSKIATADFCEQLRVIWNNTYTGGLANVVPYSSYTPTFKCETDAYGKGLLSLKIALLSYEEAVYAGGHPSRANTLYYLYNGNYTKLISSAGFYNRETVLTLSWVLRPTSTSISYSDSNIAAPLRPVINLNSNVTVAGEGTVQSPYTIN